MSTNTQPEDAGINAVKAERAMAVACVTDAMKLIDNIHNHHFDCQDVLDKLTIARDAISGISMGVGQ